ncbi:MAG: hypothetical protein CVT90_02040 [Candidatus Altiarchaeales archaeon HGW-Altiarchaeales-3]|nr:MAG: hypothetical protein CVT90_02040 [Candidatus Altiarchaeales archaeon HGW-Altiarchaeales-3]
MPAINIIGTFITGYRVSKVNSDLKNIAVSGFITYFLISIIDIIVYILEVLTTDIFVPSPLASIIILFIQIIFIVPIFSLFYGIPAALFGHFIRRRENLKLAAAGGLIFPLIFIIITILSALLFHERNFLSAGNILNIIFSKIFIVAAAGIVFSSVFPLFEKAIFKVKYQNKISKIIFFGIAISSLISLVFIAGILLIFNTPPFVVLFSCAILFSCLYLVILKTWKNPDTLKIALLLGCGLASFKLIPISISFFMNYLFDGYLGMIFFIIYIGQINMAVALLISPLIVVLVTTKFRENLPLFVAAIICLLIILLVSFTYIEMSKEKTELIFELNKSLNPAEMKIEKEIILKKFNILGFDDVKISEQEDNKLAVEFSCRSESNCNNLQEYEIETVMNLNGNFEERIDGVVAVYGDEISIDYSYMGSVISKAANGHNWRVVIKHNEDAACRFGEVATGKKGRPVDTFIDRPENTVIMISQDTYEILNDMRSLNTKNRGDVAFGDSAIELIENRAKIPIIIYDAELNKLEEYKEKGFSYIIIADDEQKIPGEIKNKFENIGFQTTRITKSDNETYGDWICEMIGLKNAPTLQFDPRNTCSYEASISGFSGTLDEAKEDILKTQLMLMPKMPASVKVSQFYTSKEYPSQHNSHQS